MGKIILCDVDLTVVDPAPFWWHWLEAKTDFSQDYYKILNDNNGVLHYDLSKYFSLAIAYSKEKIDPNDFWRNEGIYDFLYPIEGAKETLRELHDEGYRIRFVSHCKGNHHKSKFNFLKRNFPFLEGFAATKEKYMLHCDIFIDDRIDQLNKMPAEVFKIEKSTPFTQSEKRAVDSPGFRNNWVIGRDWHMIYDIIKIKDNKNKRRVITNNV